MQKNLKTLGPRHQKNKKSGISFWEIGYGGTAIFFGAWFIWSVIIASWWWVFFLFVTACMVVFVEREYQDRIKGV